MRERKMSQRELLGISALLGVLGAATYDFCKELLTPLLLAIPLDEAAKAAMRALIPAIAGGASLMVLVVIIILIYESRILE